MMQYINIDNENSITVNNKQLIPSNWKPSELRHILSEFDLPIDGNLNTLLTRIKTYIENEFESLEKEIDDSIQNSIIHEKSVNVTLSIRDYVSNNGLKICEFIDTESITDFIDLFSE